MQPLFGEPEPPALFGEPQPLVGESESIDGNEDRSTAACFATNITSGLLLAPEAFQDGNKCF